MSNNQQSNTMKRLEFAPILHLLYNLFGSVCKYTTRYFNRVQPNVCHTPHVDEEDIKLAFVEAINQMITSKDVIIRQYRDIIKTLTDTSVIEQEYAKQQNEYDVIEGLIRRLIAENSQVGLDPDVYARREAGLVARYDAVKAAMTDIEAQIQERKNRRTKLAAFIRTLEKQNGLITVFDEWLWIATVESVTVYG